MHKDKVVCMHNGWKTTSEADTTLSFPGAASSMASITSWGLTSFLQVSTDKKYNKPWITPKQKNSNEFCNKKMLPVAKLAKIYEFYSFITSKAIISNR